MQFILKLIQERDLREVQGNTNVKDLELEYNSLKNQKKAVDLQLSQLKEELAELNRQASLRKTLETLEKEYHETDIKVKDM